MGLTGQERRERDGANWERQREVGLTGEEREVGLSGEVREVGLELHDTFFTMVLMKICWIALLTLFHFTVALNALDSTANVIPSYSGFDERGWIHR